MYRRDLAMVAPSMQRWSADQETFMIWAGRRSPESVYLGKVNVDSQV